eukprot:CAMPEP_0168772686 /NCGR_PEP_ID=MMETSP0725-20121227/4083_1 /TAXON_ID=265536 /ORGANISM="Amphiprora sp., Strain CCMP467" /LENGTH=36 /DNA_ID= /DNA_START= /DNA_END= /DNA_ORIENTATION=
MGYVTLLMFTDDIETPTEFHSFFFTSSGDQTIITQP